MLFKPAQLGLARLDSAELEADRKACKKIGPCGVGKKALYLNSFYIDRRYYLPYTSITRVFKRVAMSAGGFTGKGMFASMAYLVVEYDGGKQKQCNFKDERDVDALLELLAKQQPQIRLLSAAGEQALQKKAEEKAARKLPELSDDARHTVTIRASESVLSARSWSSHWACRPMRANTVFSSRNAIVRQLIRSAIRDWAVWRIGALCPSRMPATTTATTPEECTSSAIR